MKKICICSLAYHPFIGGAEIATHEIASRLVERGYLCDVVTARFIKSSPRREIIDGITVYRVGLSSGAGMLSLISPPIKFLIKILFPFFAFFKISSLHKKRRYNLLWSIMASYAGVAVGFSSMRHPDLPVVLTIQEGDEEDHLKRLSFGSDFLYKIFVRPWHYLPFNRADHITAISSYLKERAKGVVPETPISVVSNGVDIEKFSNKPSKEELDSLKKTLGIHDRNKVLVTTSRLVGKNAVSDVIKSLKKLPEDIVFVVVGDGEKKESLIDLATKLNLRNRIILVGEVPYSELPKYLHLGDIFIRPSLSEGMGNSFIEAMASRLPVIGTRVGGIKDFLFDPKDSKEPTGIVVSPKSPEEISEAVKVFLSDNELRQKCVENAEKMVKECYQWEAITDKMEEVFKEAEKSL